MAENSPTLAHICFVISPIGREGTEIHQTFRDVLDFVIKPSVETLGYGLRVYRADDIERSGSFIKDILEYVSSAHIVIADLTNQNPNVFYELGVRHSLSPRTILISQSLEDIPSDLREYRTIIYDTSAKGAVLFRQRLEKYLKEIHDDPLRPDSPVLDRLGSVISIRTRELEAEIAQLKVQLESVLRQGGEEEPPSRGKETVRRRLDRILTIINVERDLVGTVHIFNTGGGGRSVRLPSRMGDFRLYTGKPEPGSTTVLYVSPLDEVNLEKELADIRVLMEACAKQRGVKCTFVLASNEDLNHHKPAVSEAFVKVKGFIDEKYRDDFHLEIWDKDTLYQKEKELGIRIDWNS